MRLVNLLYPQRAEGDKSNEWQQTSNPVTANVPGVEGYDPIDIQMTENFWGGLEHGSPWSGIEDSPIPIGCPDLLSRPFGTAMY